MNRPITTEYLETELGKRFTDPFLGGLRDFDDVYCGCKSILNHTDDLYRLTITDRYYDYPFLKDLECGNVKGVYAEHERVENFIYSCNLLYFNAYSHLDRLIKQYLQPFRENGVHPTSVVDVGIRFLPGDYMISLCSSLDILSLLISFIQGYPINVYNSNMKLTMLLLEKIDEREQSAFDHDNLNISLSNISDNMKAKSQQLIESLLPIIITDEETNWLEEIYDYRNYFAHKNFTATVIYNKNELYLPKKPNILPSVILDADPKDVMGYCHVMPLDGYCIDRYRRTRLLIEKAFECLISTYEWRLENPEGITNPHENFRKLNSYPD